MEYLAEIVAFAMKSPTMLVGACKENKGALQRLATATAGVVVPPVVQQRLLPLPQQLLGLPTLLRPLVHPSSTDSPHHHLRSLPVDSPGGSSPNANLEQRGRFLWRALIRSPA